MAPPNPPSLSTRTHVPREKTDVTSRVVAPSTPQVLALDGTSSNHRRRTAMGSRARPTGFQAGDAARTRPCTEAAIARTSRCSPGRGREAASPAVLTLRVYSARLDSWLPCCSQSRGSAPPFLAVQTGDPAPPSPAQAFLGGKSRMGGGQVSEWAGAGRCRGDWASSGQGGANSVLKHP